MPSPASIPPVFGPAFLEWLREATERAWDDVANKTLADFQREGVGGASWKRGTRWTGPLSDAEIDDAQERHGLHFPADYRLFLRTLHATSPRATGARYEDDGQLHAVERPEFFDWRFDDEAIGAALAWPLEGLLFDVEQGARWTHAQRASLDERKARVRAEVAAAPRLIPVVGHRYLSPVEPHVVLSVHQSDIIVYGNDLRAFLLEELRETLGLASDPTRMSRDASGIPFWGGFVS